MGNGRLRELLGWDVPTYDAVEAHLLASGQLQAGRGRGGSVSLAGAEAPAPQPSGRQNLSAFLWCVADLLRGDYKQSDCGKVILPFTVLRRLDCVLEPSKEAVLAEKELGEVQEHWEVGALNYAPAPSETSITTCRPLQQRGCPM